MALDAERPAAIAKRSAEGMSAKLTRVAVYQQARRWLAAGCFEALADDLRAVLRLAPGRTAEPGAAMLDSRSLRSAPEFGERAGYDRPSASAAPSCTWRWTRWGTCWRCT